LPIRAICPGAPFAAAPCAPPPHDGALPLCLARRDGFFERATRSGRGGTPEEEMVGCRDLNDADNYLIILNIIFSCLKHAAKNTVRLFFCPGDAFKICFGSACLPTFITFLILPNYSRFYKVTTRLTRVSDWISS